MKNKYMLIAGVVFVVIGVGIFSMSKKEPVQVACTMEAKLCPDGSAVGRFGPQCEFAPCPVISEKTEAKIGEKILNKSVYITPQEIIEDSRCPTDVVCIWAGQVVLRVTLRTESTNPADEQDVLLTLNKPVKFAGKNVTLIDVTPAKNSKVTINASDYVFKFEVK